MDRSWLKIWIIAIVLVVGLAVAYEGFLRTRHYLPTVQDDADLWSLQYDRVKSDPHAVALLGASRIQFAVDAALWSELFGGRTVAMLAVNGQYPLATLHADGVDVPAFTIALAQVLERRKLVPPLTSPPGRGIPAM